MILTYIFNANSSTWGYSNYMHLNSQIAGDLYLCGSVLHLQYMFHYTLGRVFLLFFLFFFLFEFGIMGKGDKSIQPSWENKRFFRRVYKLNLTYLTKKAYLLVRWITSFHSRGEKPMFFFFFFFWVCKGNICYHWYCKKPKGLQLENKGQDPLIL